VQVERKGSPKNGKSSSSSSSNSTGDSKATTSSSSSSSSSAKAQPKPAKPGSVPWGQFFRSPPVWAVTVAHFCFNWGYYTLLAWLPSYFELALGLNVQESSFLTLIPYVAMIAMTPVVSTSSSSSSSSSSTSNVNTKEGHVAAHWERAHEQEHLPAAGSVSMYMA
jgi:cytoskeletal protein RodZ